MKIHLCDKQPCPLQDKESKDMFDAGFKVYYQNLPDNYTGLNDPGNDPPEVLLDEDGNPVIDDEDLSDYLDDR